MKIEKININEIIEYSGNAKEHPEWQIEQIKNLVEVTNSDIVGLLAAAGNAPSIEQIHRIYAERIINKLLDKLNKQQAKDDDNLGKDIPL